MNESNEGSIQDERMQKNVDGVKNLANIRLGSVRGAEFGSRMNKMDT